MKLGVLALISGLGVSALGAQVLPLGAPMMPQAAPSASAAARVPTGRLMPASPIGANNLPSYIVPQAALIARAPSAVPEEKQTVPGTVTDPTAATTPLAPAEPKPSPTQPSDMRGLAPGAPQRSALPQAAAPAPR